jgi:hypothetical protein
MDMAEVSVRISELEHRLAQVEARLSGVNRGPEQVAADLIDLVERCTPPTVVRWFKETSLDDRAAAFFGVGKPVLEKLRLCHSKNSWDDLIHLWAEGLGQTNSEVARRKLLEDFERLELMGEVVVARNADGGEVTLAVPERTEINWDQVRERNRKEMDKAKSRAKSWLERELGHGLF